MMNQTLPEAPTPLSAIEYVQESVTAWREFSLRATELWIEQVTSAASTFDPEETVDTLEPETMTGEIMQSVSDLNLRHWQNTARFLETLPAWMRGPQMVAGSALTDWFDQIRRGQPAVPLSLFSMRMTELAPALEPQPAPTPKPALLSAPDGAPDDLTRIKGIGPKLAEKLNQLGIYHFRQIASWTAEDASWVDDSVSSKGRIMRDNWMSQARGFSANGSAHA